MTDWNKDGPWFTLNQAVIDSFVRQTSRKRIPSGYSKRQKPANFDVKIQLNDRRVASLHSIYSNDDSVDQEAKWRITSAPKWFTIPETDLSLTEVISLIETKVNLALETVAYWPVIFDEYKGWIVPDNFLMYEVAFENPKLVTKWVDKYLTSKGVSFKAVKGNLLAPPKAYLPQSHP